MGGAVGTVGDAHHRHGFGSLEDVTELLIRQPGHAIQGGWCALYRVKANGQPHLKDGTSRR